MCLSLIFRDALFDCVCVCVCVFSILGCGCGFCVFFCVFVSVVRRASFIFFKASIKKRGAQLHVIYCNFF